MDHRIVVVSWNKSGCARFGQKRPEVSNERVALKLVEFSQRQGEYTGFIMPE